MTLPSTLIAKFFKRVIRLLLYLLVCNYLNLKIISILYISIKLFHNGIPIPMMLFYPKILIFIGLFYFKIPIFMGFYHCEIPILMELSQIVN